MSIEIKERYAMQTKNGFILLDEPLVDSQLYVAMFVIEYNNDDGHYYEWMRVYTDDICFMEPYNVFCRRIAKSFGDWVYRQFDLETPDDAVI